MISLPKSPYSRAGIDDANVGGAFRGDEDATGAAAELVEVTSVDRNGATTTINDNADFIVVERDLFLIRDHRRFLGLELTHICRKLFLLALVGHRVSSRELLACSAEMHFGSVLMEQKAAPAEFTPEIRFMDDLIWILYGDLTFGRNGMPKESTSKSKAASWQYRPGKIFFPGTGFTKGELIAFYSAIADTILPHLRERPLTLKRYPDGVTGKHFREERTGPYPVLGEEVRGPRSEGGSAIHYVLCNDRATLVWVTNLADIEKRVLLARTPELNRPTSLVFDLDPGEHANILDAGVWRCT